MPRRKAPEKPKSKEKTSSRPPIERRLYARTGSNAGAKSKFDVFHEEIIERTRGGASLKDRVGGLIHTDTYWEWFYAGEEDIKNKTDTKYSRFSEKIKEAEKEYRLKLRSIIEKHAETDHKAATWLLERSDPDTYHLKTKMEVKQEVEVKQKALLELPDNGRRILPNVENATKV